MRLSVFMATSLDGFIARPDGDINWLHAPEFTLEHEDYGYADQVAAADVLVLGRNTFEMVLSFGSWPYGEQSVIVLTNRDLELDETLKGRVECLSGAPSSLAAIFAARGYRHVALDGGDTVRRFLKAGLITHLTMTRIPILLGQGIPLFGELDKDINCDHEETRHYPNGFVQSRYAIHRQVSPKD